MLAPMRLDSYVIEGGQQGRERLRILARVLHPTTVGLLAGQRPRCGS
jgi:hypothetical protein